MRKLIERIVVDYLRDYKFLEKVMKTSDHKLLHNTIMNRAKFSYVLQCVAELNKNYTKNIMFADLIKVKEMITLIQNSPITGLERKVFQEINRGFVNVDYELMLSHVRSDRRKCI